MSDFHDDSNAPEPNFGERAPDWPRASSPVDDPPRARESRSRLDIVALAPWLPRLGAALWLERKGRLTRVKAGPVSSRQEAERLKAQVKAKVGVDGMVRSHP